MFVLIRTITYASFFIGFVLVFLPARILSWSGMVRPSAMDMPQILGALIGTIGAAVALWCVFSFALIGKGTPAPFDPPRRLVIRGPYRFARNPMYIGALLALGGTALFFQSIPLLLFCGGFLLCTHFFVVFYEEPTLHRTFGADYDAYRRNVRRWLPGA